MDFEQLFDSFPLVPFAPSCPEGGLGVEVEVGPDGGRKQQGSTGVMTLEDANEIAAAVFEIGAESAGQRGDGFVVNDDGIVGDDDDDDKDKMYGDQVIPGGQGKMDDFSAFFNFGNAQEDAGEITYHPAVPAQPALPDEPFDLRALLGDGERGGFSEAELASAVTSLYTSFSTPALVPSSTRTQMCSDFEDIEQASPDDMQRPMFGELFPRQTEVVGQVGVESSADTIMMGKPKFDSFESEPAFDDVDGSAFTEQGLFGLSLFGGMPLAVQTGEQAQKVDDKAGGPLSPSHVMRLAGTVTPRDVALDMFAATYGRGTNDNLGLAAESISQTASPRQLFLPTPTSLPPHMIRKASDQTSSPPSPLIEVEQDFSRDPESGKTRKTATTSTKNKKKKPYAGPTGTRKSSRPLLDADAPTMSKSYVAPGATTRKLIPAGFQKKLKLQSDTVGDAVLPETMAEDDQQGLLGEIEEKRRRNCVAARESRRRKQEYQNGLKDEVRGWRAWAEQVEAKLKTIGLGYVLEDVRAAVPTAMDLDE